MNASNSDIYEEFRNESMQNLVQAEKSLLRLEKTDHSCDGIHELFRSIHTIKGSSDYLGFKNLTELSHSFENVLDRLRQDGLHPNDTHVARSRSLTEKLAQLQISNPLCEFKNSNKSTNNLVEIFHETLKQQSDHLAQAKLILLQSGPYISPGVRGIISRALNTIGNSSQFSGELTLETASIELKKWVLSPSQSKLSRDLVVKIENYLSLVQTAILSTSKMGPSPVTTENEPNLESKTIRVDQRVLDGFMNLVGELIVARNSSAHIQEKISGTDEERRLGLKELKDSSNHQIVRDVCRKTGKSVEVSFEGDTIDIDKGIADQIAEPLIHLVRNAVDHGIESEEKRKDAGKQAFGTLKLKASQQGNFIVIEVIDDGQGIDLHKIKATLLERTMLTPEQAANSLDSEILDYIFTPGFSTVASANDISGRGVGLDVVKTCLRKLKETVSIRTKVNEGTCFRLVVPLTMTVLNALIVQSEKSVYAISVQDVSETLKVRFDELKYFQKRRAITLRGEVVLVEWLNLLLGHSACLPHSPEDRIPILILRGKKGKFGIIVDSVYKQEEIVVKPLPESYAMLRGLAGASILGNGKAILILDSQQIYELMEDNTSDSAVDHSTFKEELANV